MLLHIPGPQPAELDRIVLHDCDNGGFAPHACSSIRPVNDPARLEKEKRHGSFRLSPVAQAVMDRDNEQRRQRRKELREALERAEKQAREARERAEAEAREAMARAAAQAREARERDEKQARDAREREAALERYAAATGSPDAACWAGSVHAPDGRIQLAVLDPAAQRESAATQHLLLLPEAAEDVDLHVLEAGVDVHHAPELVPHEGDEAAATLARYRAWQRDEALRRAEEAALAALPALAEHFGAAAPNMDVPARALRPDMDDVRLALIWSNKQHYPVLAARYDAGSESLDDFDLAWEPDGQKEPKPVADARGELERLLSARIAEKAARWAYERSFRGFQRADDAAVRQVAAEFERWRRGDHRRYGGSAPYYQYDLRLTTAAGVRLLDVKNCRAAWIDTDDYRAWIGHPSDERPPWWGRTYREHCVPQFKENRWGEPVRITGVYSPWAGLQQLLHAHASKTGQPVVVLGETDRETIERLERENADPADLEIRFSRNEWNPVSRNERKPVSRNAWSPAHEERLLPPWTFSLPAEFYPAPAAEPSAVLEHFAVATRRWERLPDELWPLFLRVADAQTAPGWTAAVPAPWKAFLDGMLARPLQLRSSLPDLFVAVLKHFLATLRADPAAGLAPSTYRTYLFGMGRRDLPLGIHDPLRTIDDLVGTLEALMEGDVCRIARYTRFRFGSAGVLQGSSDGAKWKTLVFAYCGGEKCSYQRLVLGKDGVGNCETCRHLICPRPECRFCGHHCPGHRERREQEEAARSAAAG